MPKIQSQSGSSLADIYDVIGSIAGIETLESQEVRLVHEMGGTIFSERLGAFILRLSSGAIAQSVGWVVDTVSLPDTTHKILGVTALALTAARVGVVSLAVQDSISSREIPIFTWDSTVDDIIVTRWSDDGAAVANVSRLRPLNDQLPYTLIREGSARLMPRLIYRGSTLAFGAGTVETILLIHIARPGNADPQPGDPSSHGLPIPGW